MIGRLQWRGRSAGRGAVLHVGQLRNQSVRLAEGMPERERMHLAPLPLANVAAVGCRKNAQRFAEVKDHDRVA